MTPDQLQAVIDRVRLQWPDDPIYYQDISDYRRVLENVSYVDAMRAIHELRDGPRPRSGDLAAAIGKALRAEGRTPEDPDKTDYASLAARGVAECRQIITRSKETRENP